MTALLDSKVIAIVGAGPGLGRAIAVAALRHGAATVVLGARDAASLEHLCDGLRAEHPEAQLHRHTVDVTNADSCAEFVASAVQAAGRIDTLVNNAYRGATGRSLVTSPDAVEWKNVFDVNVVGALNMVAAAVTALAGSTAPRIVNVTSMAARQHDPTTGAYGASKATLGWVTRSLASELGPLGIRVNALQPGWMMGPAVQRSLAGRAQREGITEDEALATLEDQMALGTMPTDDEVAGTAVFLASDLSAPITGQIIDVNGGHWI